MDKKSALASIQLEYEQTREDMYSTDPYIKKIMDKVDSQEMPPENAIRLLNKRYKKQ